MTFPERSAAKQWPCVQMFLLWIIGCVPILLSILVLWGLNKIF